jgi:hypothetical protein
MNQGQIFKYFCRKKIAKILAFLTRNKAKLCKIVIVTLVFEKKRQFFRGKSAKIAENCDHNIDPQEPILRSRVTTPAL